MHLYLRKSDKAFTAICLQGGGEGRGSEGGPDFAKVLN